MSTPERRKHKRKKIRTRTLLKSRWLLADAVGLDVSQGGVLVETHEEFSIGDEVEIAIDLPDHSRINCTGRVKREVKSPAVKRGFHWFGLQITAIDPAQTTALNKWLDKLG